MTKEPGRRLRRDQALPVPPEAHPLSKIHGWKTTSEWYQSFGSEENYRNEMTKLMDQRRGVGAVVYGVERAIEAQFPTATEAEWHALATFIVNDVICPVQQNDGVWRIYPISNADAHFGPRPSLRDGRQGDPNA
jgi:hypothetical protein